MKKILTVLLVLAMILSVPGLGVFAAEADETTYRATPYAEGASFDPGIWMNKFDEDGNCTGTNYVIFKTAADIKGFGLPKAFAGTSQNDQDATVRFELFKFDTDAETTLKGTPVHSEEVYMDGDFNEGMHFGLETPAPAGQYLFRITQLTGREESEGVAHYFVLPICDLIYGDTKIVFDAAGPFSFYVDCEKKDGVTDYLVALDGNDTQVDVQPERTIIKRSGDNAREITEYGIVTPVIPDGQVLYTLSLVASPTWSNTNGDSDCEWHVHKWTGDYDESIEGRTVASGEEIDHADNSNLTLKFGTALRYGNRYLIVIEKTNSGKIGYWQGEDEWPEGWEFYDFGSELDVSPSIKGQYALVGDLGPEPTEEPTKEPTEVPPTDVPTEVPVTDVPVATDAPKPTDVPDKTDAPNVTDNAPKTTGGSSDKNNEKKDSKGGNNIVPIIVIAACAVVVIGSVIAIIAAKKKKK